LPKEGKIDRIIETKAVEEMEGGDGVEMWGRGTCGADPLGRKHAN